MNVVVWGAGAIGGTVGAYLARAGHEIVLVDRDADHVAAINQRGLSITGPVEEFTVSAPARLPEHMKGQCDTVLLCTKAQHTAEACRALAPHLSADGYVVSLQNGLNELIIAELVGRERTVGAFINFGADYLSPGVIHYGGRGAVVLGEIDGRITSRIEDLHRALLTFDDQAQVTRNIWGYLWSKLAVGAMLFATALTDASIADALASRRHQKLFVAIAKEVLRVAQARGIDPEPFNGFDPQAFLPQAEPAASYRSLAEMESFNRASAKTHSGIWRDLAVRKRKTEADDQLGPIRTLGGEVGVQTPLVGRIIELVHDIEAGLKEQRWENLDALLEHVPADD